MKKYLSLLICLLVFYSCSTSDTSSNDGDLPQSNYDFYISEKGCDVFDNITKNFDEIISPTSSSFNVIENNFYTFGSIKYREGSQSPNENYGGYIKKNNTILYNDIGDVGSYVYGLEEYNGNIYFNTSYIKALQSSINEIRTLPLVWMNDTILYVLEGPYNNTVYVNGQIYSGNSFGIITGGLIVNGGNVLVGGMCYETNTYSVSYGYWENGIYNELNTAVSADSITANFKLLTSNNGDIYYYCQINHNYLYKNGMDLLNGQLDDVNITDIAILNDDVFIIATKYENGGYKLKLYKNGIFQNATNSDQYPKPKLYIEDNKIFIAKQDNDMAYKTAVYEYDQVTGDFKKIASNINNPIGCSVREITGFQVIKK